jgi:hypothetical protein
MLVSAVYTPHSNFEWLRALVLPCSAFVVFIYGAAPLIIKFLISQRAEIDPKPTLVEDLTGDSRERVGHLVRELSAMGFRVIANTRENSGMPRVLGIQLLFVQPEAQDLAYGIVTAAGVGLVRTWSIAFETRFADGMRIITVSSRSPSVFPSDPDRDVINVDWIVQPAELYAIHRARVMQSGRSHDARELPTPGHEIEYLKQEWRDELARVAVAGYFRLGRGRRSYRATVKGAYVMTWRLMWPMKQLRIWARRREARKVLRELGFEP